MNSWAFSHTRAVGVAGGGPAFSHVPVKQQHRLYGLESNLIFFIFLKFFLNLKFL